MSTNNDRVFAGRYVLDVQVPSSLSSPVWRAMDKSLKRWVTLILVPTSDLRSVRLLQECQHAASNDRRDVVAVLDVVPSGKIISDQASNSLDAFVGIVFELLDGESLDRLLIKRGEVFSVEQALRQTGVIANALQNSHDMGIFHRRLRPHNVVFSEGQDVRVSGFGVDSALLGPDSEDGIQQDIKGVGNILFAMVTGMWPLEGADSLPAAIGPVKGSVLPSQVHVDVHSGIDRIYQATQNQEFSNMRELVDALSVGEFEASENLQSRVTRFTANSVVWLPEADTKARRVRSTLIAAFGVFVFGWIGLQLLSSNFQGADSTIDVLDSPLPYVEVTESAAPPELVSVASAIPFDPYGDQSENADLADLAIDGDSATAWPTVVYRDANMGKSGVGLLLDLGQTTELSSVEVDFSSSGQSGEIYILDSPTPDLSTATKFGDVDSLTTSSSVSGDSKVSGQYVLIWITPELPQISSGNYQGGIFEVRVFS